MPYHDPITNRATGYKITATDWNNIGDNFEYLAELGYVEFTSNVSVTVTTVGSATQIVGLSAVTYENAPVLIEFFCVRANAGANSCNLILRDSTTVLGTVTQLPASSSNAPIYACRRLTPTAGSHTYNVAAWNSGAATATFLAGTGGTAGDNSTYLPGWIRATPIAT